MAPSGIGRRALRLHAGELGSAPPLSRAVDLDQIGSYRSYPQLVDELVALAEHADEVHSIGGSVEGRPLFALGFGPGDAQSVAICLAGLHAMEWIGVEVGLGLARSLAAERPVNRRVDLIPVANPDGYVQAERDLRAGKRRFARANARRVDLNRNWPTHWKPRTVARLLPFLGSAGREPRSEPEVDAICAHLDDLDAPLRRAVSLHSFGRMVLYPFGGRWRPPVVLDEHLRAGRALQESFGEPYTVRQSARWVPGAFANGMELDDLHVRHGATALLVECSAGGLSIGRPGSWLHPFRWFNPPDPQRVVADLVPALHAFLLAE